MSDSTPSEQDIGGVKQGFWKFLDEMASRSDFRPSLGFWRDVWPSIAGPELARRSSPCGWHGTTLIVEVEKGAWRHALERSKRTLLVRLAQLPWEVTELRFEDGRVDLDAHKRQVFERDLHGVELPEEAATILDAEKLDPEIADLAGRIRRHIEWEKKSNEPVDSSEHEE